MKRDLPIYQLQIDELENKIMHTVSIVEHPAIERNFHAFSKEENLTTEKFAFANEDKMILYGVAIVPDVLLYRKLNGQEFYAQFTKEDIETIVHVFMKRGLLNNLNVNHTPKDAKSYIFQSIIQGDKDGFRAPSVLGDVPVGSWVIGVQVQDPELWQDIKAGKRNGFSIEGLFKMILQDKVVKSEEQKYTNNLTEAEPTEKELKALFNQLEAYSRYLTKN